MLDDLGLAAAVRKYVQRWQQRFGLPVELELSETGLQLDANRSVALYRVLQESLTNIVRHAGATRVIVSLTAWQDGIRLSVKDDGVGVSEAHLAQARRENRLGIYGMRERLELLGGSFTLQGEAGKGVEVKVWLPLRPEEGRVL